MSHVIDLKLRLALRVVALAALCFAAASAYLLYESDQAARAKAEGIAKLVASDLELQQDQVNWLKVANDPRPDLDPSLPLYAPGVCVAYRSPRASFNSASAMGANRARPTRRDYSLRFTRQFSNRGKRSRNRSSSTIRRRVKPSSASIRKV